MKTMFEEKNLFRNYFAGNNVREERRAEKSDIIVVYNSMNTGMMYEASTRMTNR